LDFKLLLIKLVPLKNPYFMYNIYQIKFKKNIASYLRILSLSSLVAMQATVATQAIENRVATQATSSDSLTPHSKSSDPLYFVVYPRIVFFRLDLDTGLAFLGAKCINERTTFEDINKKVWQAYEVNEPETRLMQAKQYNAQALSPKCIFTETFLEEINRGKEKFKKTGRGPVLLIHHMVRASLSESNTKHLPTELYSFILGYLIIPNICVLSPTENAYLYGMEKELRLFTTYLFCTNGNKKKYNPDHGHINDKICLNRLRDEDNRNLLEQLIKNEGYKLLYLHKDGTLKPTCLKMHKEISIPLCGFRTYCCL